MRAPDPAWHIIGRPVMNRGWLLLSAILFVGCTQASTFERADEQPSRADTNFDRLPALLAGIPGAGDVLLYEGLPSGFWEPQLRERELKEKKTIRIHRYPLYAEPLALSKPEAEQLTALFSARESFKRYRGSKQCGGFQPEYCLEWKTRVAVCHALICLECGEVEIFCVDAELHCKFSGETAQKLKHLLSSRRKNRPAEQITP